MVELTQNATEYTRTPCETMRLARELFPSSTLTEPMLRRTGRDKSAREARKAVLEILTFKRARLKSVSTTGSSGSRPVVLRKRMRG